MGKKNRIVTQSNSYLEGLVHHRRRLLVGAVEYVVVAPVGPTRVEGVVARDELEDRTTQRPRVGQCRQVELSGGERGCAGCVSVIMDMLESTIARR